MSSLSLLMIVKNEEQRMARSIEFAQEIIDEIVIVDNGSTDNTVNIARKYGARIYTNLDKDLGKLRQYGLNKIKNDWVLMLDADEEVTEQLREEITYNMKHETKRYDGYYLKYRNHFLGREIQHGGEDYKVIRLFRKSAVKLDAALLHEKIEILSGKIGELKHPINHYSYRSLRQLYTKFTKYALRDAQQRVNRGEHTSLKKIALYPMHMFWARFVEDKGYKDGIFRIPLDLGFAYMEWLTYVSMMFMKSFSRPWRDQDKHET